MQMKNRGTAGTLTGKLAEELGITGDQKKRIQERQKELQKQLQEKIEKLKADTREELLQELNSEQRAKLKKLVGDKYQAQDEDRKKRRFSFPRRGQRQDF